MAWLTSSISAVANGLCAILPMAGERYLGQNLDAVHRVEGCELNTTVVLEGVWKPIHEHIPRIASPFTG